MISLYDEYIDFLQKDEGIEELLNKSYIEYIDEYRTRIKLTSLGSEYLVNKFDNFLHESVWASEENLLKISSFLSYSQLIGGINFNKYFREKISVERATPLVRTLVNYIPKVEKKYNNSYERAYEKEWRLELYKECKDIISGYEKYMIYQKSTLAFETDRLLPSELSFVLDTILLCSEEKFKEIIKESESILWPLRAIDRYRREQLLDINVIREIVNMAKCLALGKQGVLLAHLWENIYMLSDNIEDRLSIINKFTSLVYEGLSTEASLNLISCICANLVKDKFDSKCSIIDNEQIGKVLLEILSCTGINIKLKDINSTVICTHFLYNLKGRVNKEERYAGLVLANILDELDREKAKDIRMAIINEYPTFWEKKGREDSTLYFSGNLTLNLIDELANAIMVCFESDTIKTYLNDSTSISSPIMLRKYKEKHDYQIYLNEIERTMVHGILTEKIILLQNEKGKEIDEDFLRGVFRFLISVIRELPDNYIGVSMKLMVQRLSLYLGELANININIFKENYQQIINWVYDSNVLIKIIAGIQIEGPREILMNHLLDVLEIERYTLRISELIERAENLYSIKRFKEVIELASEINKRKLRVEEFKRLQHIIIYSNLQLAFDTEREEEQIKYLCEALLTINKQKRTAPLFTNSIDDKLLKIQIAGWLHDRNSYDLISLVNDFNSIWSFDINTSINEKGNNHHRQSQFMYALTLVRILSSKKSELETYKNQMNSFCKDNIDILPSMNKWLIVLIKAWYYDFINDTKLESNELESLMEYSDLDDKEFEWLPNTLREYYYKRLGHFNE
jgi:hypothetical protein